MTIGSQSLTLKPRRFRNTGLFPCDKGMPHWHGTSVAKAMCNGNCLDRSYTVQEIGAIARGLFK